MEPVLYEQVYALQQNHWWYKSRQRFLDQLLKGLPNDGSILDAGCGPGSMLNYLVRYGTVTGLDRYFPALTMCRSHFSGLLIQGDCTALPFTDRSFTMVTACEVLYHREVEDVAAAVVEFVRVLRPGGMLVVVDSAYAGCYSDHDLAAHGVRRFTKRELVDIMEDAGLEVVGATYAYAALLPVVWLVRRLKSLLGISGGDKGELRGIWKPLNDLVIGWFTFEATIAGRWGLPFGLSVQILGRKAGASPSCGGRGR